MRANENKFMMPSNEERLMRLETVIENINSTLIRMDKRFESIDARFDALESKIDKKFSEFESKMDKKFTEFDSKIIQLDLSG